MFERVGLSLVCINIPLTMNSLNLHSLIFLKNFYYKTSLTFHLVYTHTL